jgi:DNA-binding protein HU-beta
VNKAELIASMSEKSGLTKKDAEKAVNSFMESVNEALVNGEKVQLVGFGTFEVKTRKERKGRNPKTQEEMVIPASKAPVFKAGKALKDMVNQ